jgi:hypothetical protein
MHGRALALVLAPLAAASCSGPPCKPSTVFLQLTFTADVAAAPDLDVVLSLDGATEEHNPVHRARPGATDALEIDVPGYREGARLDVRVDALVNQSRTGSGSGSYLLARECTVEALTVSAVACPRPSATQAAYVDPASGTDDPNAGGGPGSCAFKTLTFALAHAPGTIQLASTTYQAPDETLPFVLTGAQGLVCNGAKLMGGVYSDLIMAEATVVLNGTANRLDGCTVIGGPSGRICVAVTNPGTGSGHVIDHCSVMQCPPTTGKGANIEILGGDLVSVSHTMLSDGFNGIAWFGAGHAGAMNDNTFDSMRNADIFCDSPDPAVTGAANVHPAGATPCFNCQGCPF